MKLYNTLTRQKQEIKPLLDNTFRIYSCGPTVYSYAHIGNMRAYLFMDVLRRVLKYNGFGLKHVMNITDVGHLVSDGDEGEDKMAQAARESKKTPWEIAEHYTGLFLEDLKRLNIDIPEILAKATDHIPEMIGFVSELMEKGYGYETRDGIYFDISRFAGYGKLSGLDLEGQIAGARVEVNPEKRNPYDFALWKKAPKEHIMQWQSPWGMGYPGWHIECSAMSRKYLGDTFDIHTGGVDHIPVHHENEIAQSDAATGRQSVKLWAHNEFLLVENGKMSKSLGNTYTLADLEQRGIAPVTYRYFVMNAHYRSKLNFTWEGVKAAQTALSRFYEGAAAHAAGSAPADPALLAEAQREFEEAASDDLNIPKALGIAWNLVRSPVKSRAVYDLLLKLDEILGLHIGDGLKNLDLDGSGEAVVPPEVMELVKQRQEARKAKNWIIADEIRDQLAAMGYTLADTPGGVQVKKS
ncbi:MAG TPA: cysteine--tRNA ligase [Clostridiales bacterium]|nr:cysteine--tRNA ligase [Clostridiales bacterium]